MEYTTDKIAKDVRTALDMNRVSTALEGIGDIDTLTLNDIIKSKIPEATRGVHNLAPVQMLDSAKDFKTAKLGWGVKESGVVKLPDDFMRLVKFRMSDWARPVYSVGTPEDSDYWMRKSPYKGLRGTPERPRCVLVPTESGYELEYYSCKDREATIEEALYMPWAEEKNGAIDVCEKCYQAMVYEAAALTYVTIGENEKGTVLEALAKKELGIQ